MLFTKRLRDGVRRGEITCSVRIWTYPHVKVGQGYRMEEGEIEIDSIEPVPGELLNWAEFQGNFDFDRMPHARRRHPFRSFDRYLYPACKAGRHSFNGCRIPARQASTGDPEIVHGNEHSV